MKYCNNCKKFRKSWAEHLNNYKDYSTNKCWECDKYELVSQADKLPASSCLNNERVRNSIREVEEGRRNEVVYNSHSCGDYYISESLECDKNGNYSYKQNVTRGSLGSSQLLSVMESRENMNICTKDLQTASSVEYKRPPSPCRIL